MIGTLILLGAGVIVTTALTLGQKKPDPIPVRIKSTRPQTVSKDT